jgi:hypothetical protein
MTTEDRRIDQVAEGGSAMGHTARSIGRRLRRVPGACVAGVALALAAAACVPPTPTVPPPTLPPDVGVQWIRDQGGTIVDDVYQGDYRRFSLLDGVVTGPTAGELSVLPITFADRGYLGGTFLRPDGTAKQPWNGFAGEGIDLDAPVLGEGEWVLQFPGGSCSLGWVDQFNYIVTVSPSPDGTKAVVRRNEDGPVHYISVVSLVDGGPCPIIRTERYSSDLSGTPTGASAGNAFVWAPDSSAVAYSLRQASDSLNHIVQLPAIAGPATTDAVTPSANGLLPMGWSIGGRILFAETRRAANGDVVSDLVTEPLGGGPTRLLDRAVESANWFSRGTLTESDVPFAHYGYFVPGTTDIVYVDGSSTVTNSDGLTFPTYDIRLIADADHAIPKSIHGTPLPVQWHQEPVFDPPVPLPFTVTDVPNVELIERFVH